MLKGGHYTALASATVALTGADMKAAVNGTPVPLAVPIMLKPGDVLETGVARRGCFGYIGIVGGIAGDRIFGSASTYLDGALGGIGGRLLRAGDILAQDAERALSGPLLEARDEHAFLCARRTGCASHAGRSRSTSAMSASRPSWPRPTACHRGATGWDTASQARVRPPSRCPGRCRYRLGPYGHHRGRQPDRRHPDRRRPEIICLGRDCGTSGAYAKIGCLIGVDTSRMAQLAPGSQLRFAEVDVREARSVRAQYQAVLDEAARRGGLSALATRSYPTMAS